MAPELVDAVGEELCSPLLVGPRPAGADDGELVPAREPVLRDLPSPREGQEAVVDEEVRRKDRDEDDGEGREDEHEDDLLLRDPHEPSQRATRRL